MLFFDRAVVAERISNGYIERMYDLWIFDMHDVHRQAVLRKNLHRLRGKGIILRSQQKKYSLQIPLRLRSRLRGVRRMPGVFFFLLCGRNKYNIKEIARDDLFRARDKKTGIHPSHEQRREERFSPLHPGTRRKTHEDRTRRGWGFSQRVPPRRRISRKGRKLWKGGIHP